MRKKLTTTAAETVASSSEPSTLLGVITTDAHGMIRRIGPRCARITGHSENELIGRHISRLIPELADIELLRGDDINPRLLLRCDCGIVFRAIRLDGTRFATELDFHRTDNDDGVQILIRSPGHA